MTVDERARTAATEFRRQLGDVEVPSAAGVVRRGRSRRRARAGMVAALLAVAVSGLVVVTRPSRPAEVATAQPWEAGLPAGSDVESGWASVPLAAAGIPSGASVSALVAVGNALFAGGEVSGEAALWRSSDGMRWTAPDHPAAAGPIVAIAGHGDELLALGTPHGIAPTTVVSFVWRSIDAGRSWVAVASSAELFGDPAPEMGRPSATQLRWSEAGFWLAAGGASDGYAGIWTSADGTRWTSVLEPGNGAGSVDIVDDRNSGLLASWVDRAWSSADGVVWDRVAVSVPSPYQLRAVAPGAGVAIGMDIVGPHTTPTPLLRSDDGRMWTVDPAFLERFPDAVATTVATAGDRVVAAGWSGDPNRPDAWISAAGDRWDALPAALVATPGGTLSLTASLGDTLVLMGTAPEMQRYFVVDLASAGG